MKCLYSWFMFLFSVYLSFSQNLGVKRPNISLFYLLYFHVITNKCIDVAGKFGSTNYDTIKYAIRQAQSIFTRIPNKRVTVKFQAGTHHLNPPTHRHFFFFEEYNKGLNGDSCLKVCTNYNYTYQIISLHGVT